MKLSEIVREVIRLGEASRAYWDRELPLHHPHYPVIGAGEKPVRPPPEDARILALLKTLPEDQLYGLMLLAYLGRGDYSADDLVCAYQDLKDTFPSVDLVITQWTGDTAIADYLTDALDEMNKRHIDLDSPQFTSTVVVS